MAHWGPSSSSSFEVWAWASSFLLRPASHCLSGGRKRDGGMREKETLLVINQLMKITILLQKEA